MNLETFKRRPLVIAHRGDTKAGLENTLPAVAGALALGVDGVEVDLRVTRDGRVVLFHDDDLKRLAGRDERIEELTFDQVRAVDLTGGFKIPTLEEILQWMPHSSFLNLELKTARPFSGELERRTVEILSRFPKKPALLLSSFQPLSLRRLRRLSPQTPRGYLFEKYWGLHRWVVPLVRPDSIHAPFRSVDRGFVDRQRRAGRRIFVWTVNDEEDMKEGIAWGVDGLITDEPRRLRDLISTLWRT